MEIEYPAKHLSRERNQEGDFGVQKPLSTEILFNLLGVLCRKAPKTPKHKNINNKEVNRLYFFNLGMSLELFEI